MVYDGEIVGENKVKGDFSLVFCEVVLRILFSVVRRFYRVGGRFFFYEVVLMNF